MQQNDSARLRILSVIITAALVIFCSAGNQLSRLHIDPGFQGSQLAEGGMAVLPVFIRSGISGISGVHDIAFKAGEAIAESMENEQPDISIITPDQLEQRISREGLADDMASMKDKIFLENTFDKDVAKKTAAALNVRFLLAARIDSLIGSENVSYKPMAKAAMLVKIWDTQA